jgi:4-hydroxy-tetrahydrodipicolinate reductase
MRRGVGILGVAGRMGRMLVAQTRAAGVALVGGCDRPGAAPPDGVIGFADAAGLAAACDVVIDFTHAAAVPAHAEAVAAAGCAWVLGTTGIDAPGQRAVAAAATRAAVVQAANFSPGVTLLLEAARRLAAALPAEAYDAEILEMHHRQKVDAPSGTALALGEAVARGRGMELAEVRDSPRDGQTGARRTGAIGFAALRGGQVVGEHSVIFAAAHEHIVLTHRAFDRAAFAAGAVRAAVWAADRPPGLYGMTDVLGMA